MNGTKITGTIASLGAQTVTPGNAQKTVACSGKYMTGNVIVPAVSNLSAANIKKGVTVGGITGTFEGWVPTATDLYYNGVNSAEFTLGNSAQFENTRIKVGDSMEPIGGIIYFRKNYDVRSFNRINIQGALVSYAGTDGNVIFYNNGSKIATIVVTKRTSNTSVLSVDITQLTTFTSNARICFNNFADSSWISHIWFS
ncbi:hypothetical protein [Clostridium sp. AM58-1XD]|uniref:hypothetical protein n=1 Tax=Clostridium sp. AM58-1XD TaxID=2292307 RepID=UPI0015F5AF16|nr:hypothetical protein [Clostridium sp. AM58-1XD]